MSAEATTTATAASPTEVKPTITTGSPVAAAASSAPASPGGDMIHPQKIGGELDADPKKKWGKIIGALCALYIVLALYFAILMWITLAIRYDGDTWIDPGYDIPE